MASITHRLFSRRPNRSRLGVCQGLPPALCLPGVSCSWASSLALVWPTFSTRQRYWPASLSEALLISRAPLGSWTSREPSSRDCRSFSQRVKGARSGLTSQGSTWLSPGRTAAGAGWLVNRGMPGWGHGGETGYSTLAFKYRNDTGQFIVLHYPSK